ERSSRVREPARDVSVRRRHGGTRQLPRRVGRPLCVRRSVPNRCEWLMATLFVVEDLAAPSVLHRGGHAMYDVQMLRGLARLGHRAVFVEFLENEPPPEAIAWFRSVMARHWSLEDAALIVESAGRSVAGLSSPTIEGI